jgi:hypothetical protein
MSYLPPESLRWLFTRERHKNGEKVIAALMDQPIDSHEFYLQKPLFRILYVL